MRKALSCVLMMTLLLTGCAGKGGGEAENAALAVREHYLAMTGWSGTVELSADLGEKVFDFTVAAQWERQGDTVLTITAPELVAGITARVRKGETTLEYDGAGLSLGTLDDEGLSPVSAIPVLMEQLTQGYMSRSRWLGEGEEKRLEIRCQDPLKAEGEGTEYIMCFAAESYALLSAEISVGGEVRLQAAVQDFTMEMTGDDAGDDENMG